MTDDLIRQSAREVVAGLAAGDLNPHDALDAVQARIEAVDHLVNALPTLCSAEVAEVCSRAMHALERDGAGVVADHPDLSDAEAAFDVPRALTFAAMLGAELPQARDVLKPELVWNIERGLAVDGDAVRRSVAAQGQVFELAAEFMSDYDLLICPAASVMPFPVEERYVGYSEGLPPSEYYRWLSIAAAVTATTLPVITVPCGRTETGLPVGLQLIGRPHAELSLFSLASHIEKVLGFGHPIVDPGSTDPRIS